MSDGMYAQSGFEQLHLHQQHHHHQQQQAAQQAAYEQHQQQQQQHAVQHQLHGGLPHLPFVANQQAALAAAAAAGRPSLLSTDAVHSAAVAANSSSAPAAVAAAVAAAAAAAAAAGAGVGAPLLTPNGTELKTHPAVRMFQQWHADHPEYGPRYQPLNILPVQDLLAIIGDWITNVQKAHGGAYTADTLYVYLSSIQRHIRITHRMPNFNLLDSEPVKTAMDKKFGENAMANLLNRGAKGGADGSAKKKSNRKRPFGDDGQGFGTPFPYSGSANAYHLPTGDMLQFKPPKPSHCHRSFHTEQRLLSTRQDPSTPEGLLRCLLWVMLHHVPNLSKTACWNLTVNQFSVVTEVQAQTGLPVRALAFQPAKKRESTSYRTAETQPAMKMWEQISMPHLCPVALFTEFVKHRPARSIGGNTFAAKLAAYARDGLAAPAIIDAPDDTSHMWLLTKKSIDQVGEHAGQWYANRRIGQGTMEKLIQVVKNTPNVPMPQGGQLSALTERAAKLANDGGEDDEEEDEGEEEAPEEDEEQQQDGGGTSDEEGLGQGGLTDDGTPDGSKRQRVRRESAVAAQASMTYGNFAGLGSQQSSMFVSPYGQKQPRSAIKKDPQALALHQQQQARLKQQQQVQLVRPGAPPPQMTPTAPFPFFPAQLLGMGHMMPTMGPNGVLMPPAIGSRQLSPQEVEHSLTLLTEQVRGLKAMAQSIENSIEDLRINNTRHIQQQQQASHEQQQQQQDNPNAVDQQQQQEQQQQQQAEQASDPNLHE